MTAVEPALAPSTRLAVREDVGRLADLYGAALGELAPMRGGRALLGLNGRSIPVANSFLDQLDDPARRLVVGLLGADLVGYGSCRTYVLSGAGGRPVSAGPAQDHDPRAERLGAIDELYVLAEARRCGVGRVVAASLLDWCRSLGCTGVDASALPGSRAVKSFFESEGFTARLLVMHRPLAQPAPGIG